MKIKVQLQKPIIDKYIKLLFAHLQNDDCFEELIIHTRKNLGLDIPVSKTTNEVEFVIKPVKVLRSETKKIIKTTPDVYVETPFILKMNKELDKILIKYKFLQDWRKGLGSLIANNFFIVSDDSSSIKLKVKNKKYLITGRHRDSSSDDGVKIVLTSKVSKTELRNWIKDNWSLINSFLDELPSLSNKSSRKPNYERDRLIVYLRKRKLSWGRIANELSNVGDKITDYKTSQDMLQQAYKDFPLK